MELRPLSASDASELRRILATPDVARWWDPPEDDFPLNDDPDSTRFTILVDGVVAGMIQYGEEDDPKYRHANVDLFVDPAVSNTAAIRAYEKVGFRRVGVMRAYERDAGGDGWHDGLLMELLAEELR